jgi:hypothetical protein
MTRVEAQQSRKDIAQPQQLSLVKGSMKPKQRGGKASIVERPLVITEATAPSAAKIATTNISLHDLRPRAIEFLAWKLQTKTKNAT